MGIAVGGVAAPVASSASASGAVRASINGEASSLGGVPGAPLTAGGALSAAVVLLSITPTKASRAPAGDALICGRSSSTGDAVNVELSLSVNGSIGSSEGGGGSIESATPLPDSSGIMPPATGNPRINTSGVATTTPTTISQLIGRRELPPRTRSLLAHPVYI